MNNNSISNVIYIMLAIIIGVLTIRFIIWLSPIILLIILCCYIYKLIKKNKNKPIKQTKNKKPIKIIDMVEDEN